MSLGNSLLPRRRRYKVNIKVLSSKVVAVKRIQCSAILLVVLASTSIVVVGFQRHGEDIGNIPLVVPVKEYIEVVNQLEKLTNNSLKDGLERLRTLIVELGNSSNGTILNSIMNTTVSLRRLVVNNTPVEISRYDFIKLALVLSIVDYYNGTFILDPLVFVKLVKAYNNARTLYLIEKTKSIDERLSNLLKEYVKYTRLNDTLKANEVLAKIRQIIESYVEKGRLEIIPLAVEVIGQGIGRYVVVDRIVFAKYVNNTSAMLKHSGYRELAVLLESIAEQLYRGYVGSAWNNMRLLQEAVLSINVSLTPELARRLAVILSVTSMTYRQVSIKISGVGSTSRIEFIANILATRDINIKRRVLELLLHEDKGREKNSENRSIDLSSTLLQLAGLSQVSSNVSLGILSPRSLLSVGRVETKSQAKLTPPSPIAGFIVVLVTSMLLLGVLVLGIPVTMSNVKARGLAGKPYTPHIELKGNMRRVVEEYIRVLRILEERGLGRKWYETPREHLERLRNAPCYEYLKVIVRVYELVVYGNRRVDDSLVRKVVEASLKVAQLCG